MELSHYYEKEQFKLKVESWISNITMNGMQQGGGSIKSKDKLYKLDVNRNKVTETDVKVTYTIKISNAGEIQGNVDILTDIIPEGFSFNQEDNKIKWEYKDGKLTTTELANEELKPGETREIQLTLRWNQGNENFGEKTNTVVLTKTSNPAGYNNTAKSENSPETKMLISVTTGLDSNEKKVILRVIEAIAMLSVAGVFIYKKRTAKVTKTVKARRARH